MRQLKITKTITSRESLAFEIYLSEIGKENLISSEEEVELAQKIKNGDEIALEKLTKANLRFVVSVAKQYQNQGLSLPDLINEGNIGLIKAARRFDETRGFKFISYAVWWIRQSILQAIASDANIVRLPLNKIGTHHKIMKIYSSLEQKFEREPTNEEISSVLKEKVENINDLMSHFNGRHKSLDSPVQEGSDILFGDNVTDESFCQPDQHLLKDSINQEILNVISTLTKREIDVLKMFYGIGYPEEMSLEQISQIFDLTRERVRQIKEKAIRKLKTRSRAKVLKRLLS